MRYCITKSDIEAIKYAIFVIEADTGDCFGEGECNGKRCFKHCGDRDCCMLRAKMMLGRILKKAEDTNGATNGQTGDKLDSKRSTNV